MIKNENNNQPNQELQGGQNQPGDDAEHLRKLFIGGLSPTTTEESLRAFFRQWGEVVDAVVMRDPVSKRSRGFGFISFAEPSMIDKAQAARPHIIDGKSVDSKRALPRPELAKPESSSTIKKIFVGGLKDVHDEKALTEHFSQFGNVIGVKILTDRNTGKKRGFAFVEFDDYDAVDKAVLHKSHIIKHVAVDVKKSVYQQELAKKLAQQQKGNMPMPPGGANPAPVPYPQHPYNQPAPYQYPSQMPPQSGMYNGWGGYGPPNAGPPYQQPPPMAGPGYGPYGGGPPNNAGSWNAAGNYPGWGQNGYSNSPAAPVPAPNANAWNSTTPQQNFGDYQQAYNGGPQKAGNLQGNRMNPYSVAPNSTYGSSAHANNMYGLPNNVSKLATAVIANGGGGGGALSKTLVPFRAGASAVDAADGASKKPVPSSASNRRPF